MVNRNEPRKKTCQVIKCLVCIAVSIGIVVIWVRESATSSSENETLSAYRERLSIVSAKLADLRKRYSGLVARAKGGNITTKNVESFSPFRDKGPGPSLKYEAHRRMIHNNFKDMWNYLQNAFDRLENVGKVRAIVDQMGERTRSLLSYLKSLPDVDGYNKWRQNEAIEVSDLIQRRLRYLQNPDDCRAAKKVVCNIPNGCGFGCQMHHIVYCLVFAYATERTLILQSYLWPYHTKGWNHVFQPISNTCTSTYGELPWSDNSAKVIELPEIRLLEKQNRPKFLPLAVPKDLAERILKFNGDPESWWIGQMVKFIFRLQTSMQQAVDALIKKITPNTPVVSVQIRRSDKVLEKEAAFHDLHEYMVHVKRYYDTAELAQNDGVRRVYLASDDPGVLKEAREKYPLYEFIGEESIADLARRKRYSPQALVGLLADLQILSRSNPLVCTFTSNFCRLVYAMMQATRLDASDAVISLDDVFYFWGTDRPSRVTVIPHYPSSLDSNEILIVPGDIINATSNLWNGYGFGTNMRTNSSGLFPWYKTDKNLFLYPFPEYKAADVD